MQTFTATNARRHIGQLVDAAQHAPVAVTRRGRPIAYVVSLRDMTHLLERRRRRSGIAVPGTEQPQG